MKRIMEYPMYPVIRHGERHVYSDRIWWMEDGTIANDRSDEWNEGLLTGTATAMTALKKAMGLSVGKTGNITYQAIWEVVDEADKRIDGKEIKLNCGFMKESETDGFALQRYVASKSEKFGNMRLAKGQEVWMGTMNMKIEINDEGKNDKTPGK